jgi:hypothetical protein
MFENSGIIPRIEQNQLSIVLYQSGKSPILGQVLRFPERIIENRHLILRAAGNGRHPHQRKRQDPQNVNSQGTPPTSVSDLAFWLVHRMLFLFWGQRIGCQRRPGVINERSGFPAACPRLRFLVLD